MQINISKYMGNFDATDLDINTLEELEDFIRRANVEANKVSSTGRGQFLVEDEVYDHLVEALRDLAPESPVLQEMWEDAGEDSGEEDEIGDYYMPIFPMKSIATIKDLNGAAYQDFLSRLDPDETYPIILESKLNGHGIRVVYNNGEFYKAFSRARGTQGRDLTPTLYQILKKYDLLHISKLEDEDIVELRGELIMDSKVFNEHTKEINAVSPLFAVASLSRESSSDKEKAMLDFIPYRLHMLDEDGEILEYENREDEFKCIEALGFYEKSPFLPYKVTQMNYAQLSSNSVIENVSHQMFEYIETCNPDFGYYTDGVVMEINDEPTFDSEGGDSKYDFGNVALKIGDWEQLSYSGYVQMVRWTAGKSKLTPTAVISSQPDDIVFEYEGEQYQGMTELRQVMNPADYVGDLWKLVVNPSELGVRSSNGSNIVKVPLYETANLFKLGVEPGSTIHFRFGAEAGVIPLTEDGKLITEM